jgi:hypothetical protein
MYGDVMALTNTETTLSRKSRFQFSLSTFLLLASTICALVLVYLVGRQNGKLRVENSNYRQELGILDILDPTKACFTAPKSRNPEYFKRWSWSVYLPAGKTYRLSVAGDKIPKTGVFEKPPWGWSSIRNETLGQQQTIDANIEYTDGKPSLRIGGLSAQLPADLWSDGWTHIETEVGAFATQTTIQPGEPLVLLRIRKPGMADVPGTSFKTIHSDPCPGLLIWIWEVSEKKLVEEEREERAAASQSTSGKP